MKSRAELFKQLQPHYQTEPVIQSVDVKIDAAKAGTHEGTTYFVDAAKTAPKIEVLFVNRYLGEPVITQGVSAVGFKLKSGGVDMVNVQPNGHAPAGLKVGTIVHTDGGDYRITAVNTDGTYVSVPYTGAPTTYTDYAGDWKMTIAGMFSKDDVIVGATLYINPRDVMLENFDAGSYPLHGAIRLLISGLAATADLGDIDEWDEIPSEWSTTKDSKEYDTDAPLAPIGCVLTTGTYSPAGVDAKQSALMAWVKLDWTKVVHNDLSGYNTDIFEDKAKAKTSGTVVETDFIGAPEQKFIVASHENCYWDNLTLDSRYWVRLQSVDAHDNRSDWFVVGSIDTGKDGTVPALASITTELFRPNIVRVSWAYTPGTTNASNVGSYQLERKEAQYLDTNGNVITPLVWGSYPVSPAPHLAETPGWSYTDTGLDRTKKYLYRVRAVSKYSPTYSAWLEMLDANAVQPQGILNMDVQANELYNRLTVGGVLSGNIAKAAITADKLYAGTITSYLTNVVNRLRGCTVKFLPPVGTTNRVDWAAGSVTLAKATYSGATPSTLDATWGTSILSVSAGTTSSIAFGNYYYAYVTYTVDSYGEPTSVGNVQFATTYPIGQYDIVLAVVTCDSQGRVNVEAVTATGTIINGDHILTGSIDAVKIHVTDLSSISANIGIVTSGMLRSSDPLGSYFDLTNGKIYIKSGKVSVDTGAISTSQLANDLVWTDNTRAETAYALANTKTTAAEVATTLAAYATKLDIATKITAGEVQNAIRDNVTIIDGAKLTTGSIAAGKIQLYGITTSALDNNAGWTTDAAANAAQGTANGAASAASNAQGTADGAASAASVADGKAVSAQDTASTAQIAAANALAVANLKIAAADVANAINNNVTTIDGAKITTGTIIAGKIQLFGITTSALNNNAGWTTDAAANAAQGTANGAAGAASTAQATANGASSAASTAQGTANGAASAALIADGKAVTAQDTANGAASAASTAQIAAANALAVANLKIAAADVANAINNNVTTIDGAKITTGSIVAGKIQLFGISTSALNNNAGWTTDAAANAAQATANGASSAASTAQGTANGAASASSVAQGTADGAASAASVADGKAVSAQSAASAAYTYAGNAYGLAAGKIDANGVQNAITYNVTTIDGAKITTGMVNARYVNSGAFRTNYYGTHRIELTSGCDVKSDYLHLYDTNYEYMSFNSGYSEYAYIKGYANDSSLNIYAAGQVAISNAYGVGVIFQNWANGLALFSGGLSLPYGRGIAFGNDTLTVSNGHIYINGSYLI